MNQVFNAMALLDPYSILPYLYHLCGYFFPNLETHTLFSRHPEVKWAQRVDKIYITVLLPDAKNAKVNLEPEGLFTFSASAGTENHLYELKLNLHDKVDVEVRIFSHY